MKKQPRSGVQRNLAQVVAGSKQDIGNAANLVGRAAVYYAAMKNYKTAADLQGWFNYTKDTVTGPVAKGVAVAAGAGRVYGLWRYLTGK